MSWLSDEFVKTWLCRNYSPSKVSREVSISSSRTKNIFFTRLVSKMIQSGSRVYVYKTCVLMQFYEGVIKLRDSVLYWRFNSPRHVAKLSDNRFRFYTWVTWRSIRYYFKSPIFNWRTNIDQIWKCRNYIIRSI